MAASFVFRLRYPPKQKVQHSYAIWFGLIMNVALARNSSNRLKLTPIVFQFLHAALPLILVQLKEIPNWWFAMQLQLTVMYSNRLGG